MHFHEAPSNCKRQIIFSKKILQSNDCVCGLGRSWLKATCPVYFTTNENTTPPIGDECSHFFSTVAQEEKNDMQI